MYVAAKEKNNPVAYKEFEGDGVMFHGHLNNQFCYWL